MPNQGNAQLGNINSEQCDGTVRISSFVEIITAHTNSSLITTPAAGQQPKPEIQPMGNLSTPTVVVSTQQNGLQIISKYGSFPEASFRSTSGETIQIPILGQSPKPYSKALLPAILIHISQTRS